VPTIHLEHGHLVSPAADFVSGFGNPAADFVSGFGNPAADFVAALVIPP